MKKKKTKPVVAPRETRFTDEAEEAQVLQKLNKAGGKGKEPEPPAAKALPAGQLFDEEEDEEAIRMT